MEITKISALLDDMCQNVGGKWLLTGGSLIQLQVDGARATEDIDLVAIEHESLSDVESQNELFKSAIRLGLSAENVNSAAGFFVNKVPHWEKHLIELMTGSKGCIFRPDLTLFIVLKLARGSPVDLRDVALAINFYGKEEFESGDFEKMADSKALQLFQAHRAKWGI